MLPLWAKPAMAFFILLMISILDFWQELMYNEKIVIYVGEKPWKNTIN